MYYACMYENDVCVYVQCILGIHVLGIELCVCKRGRDSTGGIFR